MPVLVGLWDAQGDLTKARQRLESVGLRTVATDAATVVRELVQRRLPLLQGVRSAGPDESAPEPADARAPLESPRLGGIPSQAATA